jgi:hypothetical protein
VEKSKDEAMKTIAHSGTAHTSYYWNLASPTDDCPNWIARWFLYHKFRYRDGRNRNPAKAGERNHSHHGSSKHSHHGQNGGDGQYDGYYDPSSYSRSTTYGVYLPCSFILYSIIACQFVSSRPPESRSSPTVILNLHPYNP